MGEDLAIVWIIVGFLGVIIGVRFFFGLRKERRRREELTAGALRLRISFCLRPDE